MIRHLISTIIVIFGASMVAGMESGPSTLPVDHLVYGTPDLGMGIERIEKLLGQLDLLSST